MTRERGLLRTSLLAVLAGIAGLAIGFGTLTAAAGFAAPADLELGEAVVLDPTTVTPRPGAGTDLSPTLAPEPASAPASAPAPAPAPEPAQQPAPAPAPAPPAPRQVAPAPPAPVDDDDDDDDDD